MILGTWYHETLWNNYVSSRDKDEFCKFGTSRKVSIPSLAHLLSRPLSPSWYGDSGTIQTVLFSKRRSVCECQHSRNSALFRRCAYFSFSYFLFEQGDESKAPISRSSRLLASQNLDRVREGSSSHCVWMSPYCVSPNPCNRSSCSLRWSPKGNRKVCATISWTFGPSRSMTAADWPYLRLPCTFRNRQRLSDNFSSCTCRFSASAAPQPNPSRDS